MTGAPLVRLAGLSVTYPGAAVPALDAVSLDVCAGEGVALLGPNGAGKTTLLRAAMALVRPRHGSIEIAGIDSRGLRPEDLASRAGYLFQNPGSQLFERTVRLEVGFGPRQLGWPADRIARAAASVLAELELDDVAGVHPYDLPAPRRRLVALAATLVAAPVVLLLDEPTAGLDAASRRLVERAVVRRTAAGAAVLAVTHDGEFALEALGRAVVLEAGRVTRDAAIEDVLGSGPDVPMRPPHAAIARALELDVPALTRDAVAAALSARCRRGR